MLCDFIKRKYGISLIKKRVLIEYRLMNTMNRLKAESFTQYLNKVKQDTSGYLEEELINRLTTNYTFFMREPSHFQIIEDRLLPYADKKRPFHIWVAGCSSGQECYTLVMRLEDLRKKGVQLPEITITASDISTKVLQQARTGTYAMEALENLPAHWKQSYCHVHEKSNTFTLCSHIKKQVCFIHQNLMEPFRQRYFHLILCRNVLIYFDEESRQKIYDNFACSLKSGGYLILGHAEMIPQGNPHYEYMKSSVYRLKEMERFV